MASDEQDDRRIVVPQRNQRESDWLTCLNDVTSTNRFTRTNALKRLERSLIPEVIAIVSVLCLLRCSWPCLFHAVPRLLEAKLDVRLSLELLDGSLPLDGDTFGSILLGILANDTCAELCRETSAIVLRDFLAVCFGTAELSQEDSVAELEKSSRRLLGEFYIQFCHMFHGRFSCHTKGSSGTTPKEGSEEIRLLLAQIASHVLGFMIQQVVATTVNNGMEGPANNVEVVSPAVAISVILGVSHHAVTEASSLLCQSLAMSALRDPYPDLKRECCIMMEQLSILFPSTVRMHAQALLRPITGISSDSSSSSSRDCLMRHKHSKTRCLGLQATTHILSCCPSDECVDSKGSSGGTLEHLLHSRVLACWEEHTILDQAVSVRLELTKSVGMIARRIGNRNKMRHNNSKLASHLVLLLLVGMSDDSTDVQELSSILMFHWANGFGEESSWNTKTTQDCLSCHVSGFISSLMHFIVNTIQHDVLANWSVERGVTGLNALRMALTLTRPYNCELDCEHVSAEKETSRFKDDARTVAAILLECVQSNEAAISNAAFACAQALGENDKFAVGALDFMLPALVERKLEGSSSLIASVSHMDLEDEAGNVLFSSSPQMIGAALSVMAYMIKGYIALARDGDTSCGYEISWCSSNVLSEISNALTTDLVIQSVFSSQVVAWALMDMCSAIVKGGQVFHLDQMESPDIDKPHSIPWCIALCCIYLMGLNHEFGVYQGAVGALESLGHILHASNDIEQVLHVYFPTILSYLDQSAVVVWNMKEPQLCAFEALLRHSGGSTLGYNFEFMFRILERQMVLEPSKVVVGQQEWTDDARYSMKIWAMALFETVISKSGFPTDLLHPYTQHLLDSIVLPNLIWKPGKMAPALRKLSAATLFSLLRAGGLMTDISLEAVQPILLALKQTILDDDGTTRELVCLSLVVVFDLLPEPLGTDEVNTFYPDLIKCIDDDKHNVRFAAMNATKAFLKAAQHSTFQGTPIEYVVDALLVHMVRYHSMSLEEQGFVFFTTSIGSRVCFLRVESLFANIEGRSRSSGSDLCLGYTHCSPLHRFQSRS
eukprot:scaffold74907_cov43-Attheya_sp.AAC.1